MTHSGILGDERDGEAAGGLMEGSETATQAVRPLFSPSIPGRATPGSPSRRDADSHAARYITVRGEAATRINAAVCFTSSVVAFQFEAFF